METAKALINSRIDNEIALRAAIIAEIRKAFNRLAELGYAGTIKRDFRMKDLNQKQLEKILTDLRLAIYMWILRYCNEMAEETHEAYPFAKAPYAIGSIGYLGLPNSEQKSNISVRSLINTYTNRFKFEVETWLAIGLSRGLTLSTLKAQFTLFSNLPFNNPLFNEAKKQKDLTATRIQSGGVSYGVGKYTSAENSLVRLGRYAVADITRNAQWHEWTADGAPLLLGYNVSRGSTYPCSYCDMMCGFHPAGRAWLPPYHAHCCCIAVPVFSNSERSSILALL